jgi:phosphatidate cytidylyltransferase
MSPSVALHDAVFRTYLVLVLGLLFVAGVVLALLQFVFRIELGSVWKTYCGWLWMAPLVALVIFAGRVPFIIGVTVVSLLAAKEFSYVSGLARDRWMSGALYVAILLLALGAAPIFALALLFLVPILRNRTASVVAGIGDPGLRGASSPAGITDPGYNGSSELQRLSLGVLAFVLLGWMFCQLGFFARTPNAYGYLCFVIFATEVTDVSAFVFGKMSGRHALRIAVSPRKTWEGALGGLAVALILPWLLRFSFPFFGTAQLILTGLIVGLGGPLGDLSLSLLKREFGAKDWGTAIPGHGGVLDRIDSLIFVVPLFMLMAAYYYPGR